MVTEHGLLDWFEVSMRDPEPPECAGCLRRIGGANLWLCDPCVAKALAAGFEATPHHHPGKDCTEYLWKKTLEAQRAKTT